MRYITFGLRIRTVQSAPFRRHIFAVGNTSSECAWDAISLSDIVYRVYGLWRLEYRVCDWDQNILGAHSTVAVYRTNSVLCGMFDAQARSTAVTILGQVL